MKKLTILTLVMLVSVVAYAQQTKVMTISGAELICTNANGGQFLRDFNGVTANDAFYFRFNLPDGAMVTNMVVLVDADNPVDPVGAAPDEFETPQFDGGPAIDASGFANASFNLAKVHNVDPYFLKKIGHGSIYQPVSSPTKVRLYFNKFEINNDKWQYILFAGIHEWTTVYNIRITYVVR